MNRILRYFLIGLCLLAGPAYSQINIPSEYTYSADSLALYLSSHYPDDTARLKALYTWMTHTMSYNVYTTFESRNDIYSEEKDVKNTLRNRTGVCRNFALVFKTVADAMDIPCFAIEGYVKTGSSLMTEPHAWNCAKAHGVWYLYDVTFGMGQIANNQFVSKPSMDYCQLTPQQMLENHMPFDPIWQLMEAPYAFHIYDKSATLPAPAAGTPFNYNDSIRIYVQQDKVQQTIHAHHRMSQNGTGNPLVKYYLELTLSNIDVYKKQAIYDVYKGAIKSFNKAIDDYNDFVHYRKAKFQPAKEEHEVRGLLQGIEFSYSSAHQALASLTNIPEEYVSAIENLRESILQVGARTEKQKEFVNSYYKASPSKRKSMFTE